LLNQTGRIAVKTILLTLFVLFAAIALPKGGHAQEFEKNIMTGGPKGTYIQIGRDLARIGGECGVTLNVVESAGSLENFAGVRNRRNTQFGIVQSDILEYLKVFEAQDREVQQAVRGVRIMFPLYNEEIHLLAKKEIAGPRDLAGRKVSIGVQDSGTFLTASLILDILRVEGAERVKLGTTESLEKFLAGEIDALFYVAGAPASLFADPRIDPARHHLVPLDDAALKATYIATEIPAGAYAFQQAAVPTVAVKAVLMTFEYDPARNAYHRQSCNAVSDVANLMLTNLDRLKGEGHPKWKSVELTDLPPGWQVGACVKRGMALDYKVECRKAEPAAAQGGDDEYLKLLKQRLNSGN
jgi:TRAP transporter TAXI family solute receptor